MTTVEILYRYAAPPTEQVAMALARARDVYGIRHLSFDRAARTLRVEFDATRLNAAAVTKLVARSRPGNRRGAAADCRARAGNSRAANGLTRRVAPPPQP